MDNNLELYQRAYDLFQSSLDYAFQDRTIKVQESLGRCIDSLQDLYKKGIVASVSGLPREGLLVFGLDEEGIKGLQEKLFLEYFSEKCEINPLNFDSQEQANNFCIPGKYLLASPGLFERIVSYFFTQAIKGDIQYTN